MKSQSPRAMPAADRAVLQLLTQNLERADSQIYDILQKVCNPCPTSESG